MAAPSCKADKSSSACDFVDTFHQHRGITSCVMADRAYEPNLAEHGVEIGSII